MLLAGYSHKHMFEYSERNMNVVLLLDSCTINFKVSGTPSFLAIKYEKYTNSD